MTTEQKYEVIKALAYGMTFEQIADVEDMALKDVEAFAADHAADVTAKKNELKEQGWNEND